MSYDPGRAGRVNRLVASDFAAIQKSWERFAQDVDQLRKQKEGLSLHAPQLEPEFYQLADKADQPMQEFVTVWNSILSEGKPVQDIEPVLAKLRRATAELDAKMRQIAAVELPEPGSSKDDIEEIRVDRQIFSRWTRELALQTAQLHWAIYSEGDEAINLVPSLEPTSLEADRFRSEIHPWISLYALLRGSPGLLNGYPDSNVEKIRTSLGRRARRLFQPGQRRRRESICRCDRAVHARRPRAVRRDRARSAGAED